MKEAISWATLACLKHKNNHEGQTGLIRRVARGGGIYDNCAGRSEFSSRCTEFLLCL